MSSAPKFYVAVFAVFIALLFLASFRYVIYSVAVSRQIEIMLYSACESSAE